jgi:ATP-binding cassette subfamily B protein
VVLEQGELVEEGDHDALMSKQGAYWRLYEAQAKNAEADRAKFGDASRKEDIV